MATVFINELHYENVGVDIKEGAEIAGPAGKSLDGYSLHVYSGQTGKSETTVNLKGVFPSLQNGFGVLFFSFNFVNFSSGTGLALVDPDGSVVQFLAVTASFVAKAGPASGKKAELIPVKETVWTSVGLSLQLQGTGNKYEDFKWVGPVKASYGSVNNGQTFVRATTPINLDLNENTNRIKHHTDKFHTTDMLVLRRGDTFLVGFSAAKENVGQLVLRFKVYPEGTTKDVKVADKEQPPSLTDFSAYLTNESKVYIVIKIPGCATVGEYLLSISSDGGRTWHCETHVIILFNAWSTEDPVFMSDEEQRKEYVLADDGLIWVGNQYSFAPRAWNFAQFNTKSLMASLKLLQQVAVKSRGDPVQVARRMSALVNAADGGILEGNWSSDYSGGTSPTAWTGSAEILKEYLLTGKSVKYGQCWVFSGVLTTVMRALGIPARSVTNFASAHDVPLPKYNRSVDRYFKKGGLEPDEHKTRDSVWNFHVWNDVWMEREDLGPSYFGWQIIDATPQELSAGTYQTGPAPLVAIKDGTKDIPFDLEFVYSEVNADENYYVETDDGSGYTLIRTITNSIGKNISTKAVGSNRRHDLTADYKYPEGSLEERVSHGSIDTKTGDVQIQWVVDDHTPVGAPIAAKLVFETTATTRSAQVLVVISVNQYTGKLRKNLYQERKSTTFAAGKPATLTFDLDPKVYEPNLQLGNNFAFKAFVKIQETSQTSLLVREFNFKNFNFKIEAPQTPVDVGSTIDVVVKFTNSLSIPLNGVKLSVEGQALTKVQRFALGTLKPGETLTQNISLTALEKGAHLLIAQVDTNEIPDVFGHAEIVVK